MFYIVNNNFDLNNTAIKSNNSFTSKNKIISNNNIYSFNKKDFDINNYSIINSYCLSNKTELNGYYNIFGNPEYVNSLKFNYKLNNNSPALRSGNNNNNLGININTIYNIKYLKY